MDVSLIILIPDLIDGTGENIEKLVAEAIATHVQLSPGGGG